MRGNTRGDVLPRNVLDAHSHLLQVSESQLPSAANVSIVAKPGSLGAGVQCVNALATASSFSMQLGEKNLAFLILPSKVQRVLLV